MKTTTNTDKHIRLIKVLQEGVTVVQMILFKELREILGRKYPDQEPSYVSTLTGSLINDLFNSKNPDEKFQHFYKKNKGVIEQELLGLAEQIPNLRGILSDALRVQVLCNGQEEESSNDLLKNGNDLGILIKERDIPLPSIFMTRVRELGADYNLIMPPVQIDSEDDKIVQ